MREINFPVIQQRLADIQPRYTDINAQAVLQATTNKIISLLPPGVPTKKLAFLIFEDLVFCLETLPDSTALSSCLEALQKDILSALRDIDENVKTSTQQWRDLVGQLANVVTNFLKRVAGDQGEASETQAKSKKIMTTGYLTDEIVKAQEVRKASGVNLDFVLSHADWVATAIDVKAHYVRVNEPIEERGEYRFDGNRTACLCDAYMQVMYLVRPHGKSKRAFSTIGVRFVNRYGETKDLEITEEDVTSGAVTSKLTGFCSFPETDVQRRQMLELLRKLSREGQMQERAETFSWQVKSDGTLTWLTANGCETETDFLSSDKALFVAPEVPGGGNGYYGANVPLPVVGTQGAMWHLHMRYVEDERGRVIIASVEGGKWALMIPADMLPEGIAVENGTLRYSPEIVGPPRRGKNRVLNAIQSGYGLRFRWNAQPLLSIDKASKDSAIGRNGLMSKMPYILYADGDHKASPDEADFERQHTIRMDTLNLFNDALTGGRVGTRTGGMRARDIPAGGNIRTCNYDHAPYSIEHGEAMVEERACTFIWPEEVVGDYETSRYLDQHRQELYAYDQAYRRWIMRHYREDKEAFRELVAFWYDLAHSMVADYDWAESDLHRNQAEVMVLGILLYQQFLEEVLPGHFLHRWLEERLTPVIEARVQRSAYIRDLVAQRAEKTRIENFVPDAIRYLMSGSQIYIRSQRDELLTEEGIAGLPFGMKEVGYHSARRRADGVETEIWDSGSRAVGYLVHRKQDFAFDLDLLMQELKQEAGTKRRNVKLGTQRHILSTLVEKSIVLPDIDKKTDKFKQNEQLVKIAGKPRRLVVIPVSTLFPVDLSGEDEGTDEDTTTRPQAYCHECDRMLWVHLLEGDTVKWVCGKCGTPYDPDKAWSPNDEIPEGALPLPTLPVPEPPGANGRHYDFSEESFEEVSSGGDFP